MVPKTLIFFAACDGLSQKYLLNKAKVLFILLSNMFEFIFSAANVPFGVALAIVFFIALLEGVGALFGAGLSQFVDSMLPEMDFDLDIEGPEIESPGIFVQFLSWLRFGQVPFIILLVVILTLFGLTGFALQTFVAETFGAPLPAWLLRRWRASPACH